MNILVSQHLPSNKSPWETVEEKYGAKLDFHPLFIIEPVSSKEFRSQKINLPDYTAVTFSSRHAIDAYFKLAEEMRFKVPETMKYFCTTELIANYLQKHIVFRKRKIFSGNGTPESVISLIGSRHKGEKFLLTATEGANISVQCSLMEKAGLDYSVCYIVKPVAQDLSELKLSDYDIAVLYSPHDVEALQTNFPDFKQGELKVITFGKGVAIAAENAGFEIALTAPTPEAPSAAKALEIYLKGKK